MLTQRFSLDLATVVFRDEAADMSAAEERHVARFRQWLHRARSEHVHRHCASIDEKLIPSLGHTAMLEVARLVEARFPEVIENMPNLRAHRDHLDRVGELAQVFRGPNLEALLRAIEAEGARS